jgi:hypothetical protein
MFVSDIATYAIDIVIRDVLLSPRAATQAIRDRDYNTSKANKSISYN